MGQGRPRVIHQWRPTSGSGMPSTEIGTMLIVGVTEWGPEDVTESKSWTQWKDKHGGYLLSYETALQVDLYFRAAKRAGRGGKVLTKRIFHYVSHTVAGSPASAAKGTRTLQTDAGAYGVQSTLRVDGLYYGALALTIQVLAATNGSVEHFDLLVYHPRMASPIERFRNLTMDTTAMRYAVTVINTSAERSSYISVTDLVASGTATQKRPANDASAVVLTGGHDGLTALAATDYIGGAVPQTGLYGFGMVNEGSLLTMPDINDYASQDLATTWCRDLKGGTVRFITDCGQSADKATVKTQAAALTDSIYRTAIYWPHVKVANPDKTVYGQAETITVRPSGQIAGRYCFLANDGFNGDRRGPFISPSNEQYGLLEDAVGLEGTEGTRHEALDPTVQDEVNDVGINVIVSGRRGTDGRFGVWATRGSIGDPEDDDLQSVGNMFGTAYLQRRYEDYLQRHLTQDNSEPRRRTIQEALETDLGIWTSRGCFASTDASDAFVVDVDPEGIGINNPLVQLAKNAFIIIGLAYSSPMDFIYLVFTKDDRAVKSYMQKVAQGSK